MEDNQVITMQQNRISELEELAAKWKRNAKESQAKAMKFREENERFAAALEEVAKERDQYKQAIEAEPHELQAQVDEYKGKLRDRDHRDKFRELGRKAGVTADKALDDLYQLSGYKPEADEIDEAKITTAITSALQGRDWLKSAAGAAAPAAGAANGRPAGAGSQPAGAGGANLQPGPGASRGGASVKDDTDSVLEAKYPNAYRLA